jgi:uncharacterized iron-regulated membrane protein
LFGLANQLLGLATAIGLMLLCVSSVVLWWRRRPEGMLGAPIPLGKPSAGWAFGALLLAFALLLPMLGLSLLAVFAVERLVLRHIPSTCRWLGLRQAEG